MKADQEVVFGPVPSRRLGRSLGINNIPPKICSYSCVYCQLGRTMQLAEERRAFYPPEEIAKRVQEKVHEVTEHGELIDYLTFVPDGEPSLDINLGQEIEQLKPLGISIAVISNASLIDHIDVQADLMKADWVSLKVDAVQEKIWHQINRPYRTLRLDNILKGMIDFSENFQGLLATETMLVQGLNDNEEHLRELASFLNELVPDVAYLAIPTRPPAEEWVHAIHEDAINRAYQILSEQLGGMALEYLIGYEGDAFVSTGNAEADLLSITAVHPMQEQAVDKLLRRAGSDWSLVRDLIAHGQLVEAEYRGKTFYMRRFQKPLVLRSINGPNSQDLRDQ
jgi:wyosine [tRNA(Phe)-imidazoG37] synthetase (radical SAM superfamily)